MTVDEFLDLLKNYKNKKLYIEYDYNYGDKAIYDEAYLYKNNVYLTVTAARGSTRPSNLPFIEAISKLENKPDHIYFMEVIEDGESSIFRPDYMYDDSTLYLLYDHDANEVEGDILNIYASKKLS